MRLVQKQRRELGRAAGKTDDFQLTLKMLEQLREQTKQTKNKLAQAEKAKAERKPRSSSGPTEQPNLPIVEQTFVLDEPDRRCPSCGGDLGVMKDQFEESEMIDVVEVNYRLVKVKQQKYVCKCGG